MATGIVVGVFVFAAVVACRFGVGSMRVDSGVAVDAAADFVAIANVAVVPENLGVASLASWTIVVYFGRLHPFGLHRSRCRENYYCVQNFFVVVAAAAAAQGTCFHHLDSWCCLADHIPY